MRKGPKMRIFCGQPGPTLWPWGCGAPSHVFARRFPPDAFLSRLPPHVVAFGVVLPDVLISGGSHPVYLYGIPSNKAVPL